MLSLLNNFVSNVLLLDVKHLHTFNMAREYDLMIFVTKHAVSNRSRKKKERGGEKSLREQSFLLRVRLIVAVFVNSGCVYARCRWLSTMRPRLNGHKEPPTQDNIHGGGFCF